MSIPVVWASRHLKRKPNPIIARGYWDQAFLEDLFSGEFHDPAGMPNFHHVEGFASLDPAEPLAIVVIPARWHVKDMDWLNMNLGVIDSVLLILTGDEDSEFDVAAVSHPRIRIWAQTPNAATAALAHPIGEFYTPSARVLLEVGGYQDSPDWDFTFAGQINNERREECVEVLRGLPNGQIHETDCFGCGLDPVEYIDRLSNARVAPAPSGIFTPSTFRAFEALEAGAIPVVDAKAPRSGYGYWDRIFGPDHPIPVIDHWMEFPALLDQLLDQWPVPSNRIQSWYGLHKRATARKLVADLAQLDVRNWGATASKVPRDRVTVLLVTSPIPSHPSTSIIEETVASIRAYPELGECEILILADGVRPEQEHRREDYEGYLHRLLWLASHRWRNVCVVRHEEFQHQANMTRDALDLIDTDLLLFMEHDTPLVNEIPWADLIGALDSDTPTKLIRLSHEGVPPVEWEALMIAREPGPVPLQRTRQWSQRPHLATVALYRHLLATYFHPDERTMIEDVLHSSLEVAYTTRGVDGWAEFGTSIYWPDGLKQRSLHTDGREGDEKFEMILRPRDDSGLPKHDERST